MREILPNGKQNINVLLYSKFSLGVLISIKDTTISTSQQRIVIFITVIHIFLNISICTKTYLALSDYFSGSRSEHRDDNIPLDLTRGRGLLFIAN